MATKVRVIENGNESYDFCEIQILEESSNKGFMGSFSSIGSITFQKNKGEKDWYGLRYVVNTTRFRELKEFSKIAKMIDENANYRSQPDEIIEIVNGRKYAIFNNDFFAIADKGKYCFNVMENDSIYARIVAKDAKGANKILDAFKKKNTLRQYDFSIGTSILIE
jgi:hypothetical protein